MEAIVPIPRRRTYLERNTPIPRSPPAARCPAGMASPDASVIDSADRCHVTASCRPGFYAWYPHGVHGERKPEDTTGNRGSCAPRIPFTVDGSAADFEECGRARRPVERAP